MHSELTVQHASHFNVGEDSMIDRERVEIVCMMLMFVLCYFSSAMREMHALNNHHSH